MNNRIHEIHESEQYGFVVETGCSTALSGALMDVPGASKTVYFCKQPYSKEYEALQYNESGRNYARSVSKEFVQSALEIERSNIPPYMRDKVNFGLVTSWQVATTTDEITHGWYCVFDKTRDSESEITLHVTIPGFRSRSENLEIISRIGVAIIGALEEWTFYDLLQIDEAQIDVALIRHGADEDHPEQPWTAFLVTAMERAKKPYMLAFDDTTGEPVRLVDILRQSNEFVVERGSFNPLHHQHVEMLKAACQLHPASVPVFLISTYRWDKPHIDIEELQQRIDNITSKGFAVLLMKEPLFYDAFKILRNNKDKMFYFVMGSDTVNRIWQTDLGDSENSPFKAAVTAQGYGRIWSKNFRFLVHNREGYPIDENIKHYGDLVELDEKYQDDGTSSTKIRNGEIKNKLD